MTRPHLALAAVFLAVWPAHAETSELNALLNALEQDRPDSESLMEALRQQEDSGEKKELTALLQTLEEPDKKTPAPRKTRPASPPAPRKTAPPVKINPPAAPAPAHNTPAPQTAAPETGTVADAKELLRDPFWPVGFKPASLSEKTENETAQQTSVSDADWDAAKRQLNISGTSRINGQQAVIINGLTYLAGNTVSVKIGNNSYSWEIREIRADGAVIFERKNLHQQ